MKLLYAILKAKEIPNSVVVYGPNGGNWTEYSVQHYWENGELHWTAGWTVGGVLKEGMESSRIGEENLYKDGFEVYSHNRELI